MQILIPLWPPCLAQRGGRVRARATRSSCQVPSKWCQGGPSRSSCQGCPRALGAGVAPCRGPGTSGTGVTGYHHLPLVPPPPTTPGTPPPGTPPVSVLMSGRHQDRGVAGPPGVSFFTSPRHWALPVIRCLAGPDWPGGPSRYDSPGTLFPEARPRPRAVLR